MNQDRKRRDVFTFSDVAKRGFEIATCSCVFRSNPDEPIPKDIMMQDWAILLYYSSGGDIKYLDEVMGTYRRNEGGITNFYSPEKALYFLSVVQKIKKYFAPRNTKDFDRLIANFSADVCFTYFRGGDYPNFVSYYTQSEKNFRLLSIRARAALFIRQVLCKNTFLSKIYIQFSEKKRKTLYRYQKKV